MSKPPEDRVQPPAERPLVEGQGGALVPFTSTPVGQTPPPPAVSQWTRVTVNGRDYNATVGLEGQLELDGNISVSKYVVVIYTGRAKPLYCRGESLHSIGDAMTEASQLIIDLEAEEDYWRPSSIR